MQRSVNYDMSRVVRMGDDDEPAVERLPVWTCLLVDGLVCLILWALLFWGIAAAGWLG